MTTLQTIGLWLGAVAAGLAILTGLVKGGHWVFTTLRKIGRLVDDVMGTPAHGGLPPRASLMDRIGALEQRMGRVEAQLVPNGGSSVADAVSRIARAVGTEPIPPVHPEAPPAPASPSST